MYTDVCGSKNLLFLIYRCPFVRLLCLSVLPGGLRFSRKPTTWQCTPCRLDGGNEWVRANVLGGGSGSNGSVSNTLRFAVDNEGPVPSIEFPISSTIFDCDRGLPFVVDWGEPVTLVSGGGLVSAPRPIPY